MLSLFLLNITVFLSSACLLKRYLRFDNAVSHLLAFAAVFYCQLVLILLFWGVLGRLYLVNIIASCLGILLICLLPKRGNIFPPAPRLPDEIIKNKTFIFCLSCILAFGLVKLAINLANPPFGWDSLNYHFTFPVEWLKHGNLRNPITINDDLAPSYYPINGSLIYLWFILPLKNVFLADLGQIPFFAISFIAVYGICRRINISREYSLYAASLFTITPNYFKQMEIAYVDVMAAGWFLSALYFLLDFFYQPRIRNVILFALGLGMLAATKTTALPYAALLFAFFTLVLLNKYKVIKSKRVIAYFLSAAALVVVIGGYGYSRNFIQAGNPLYPLTIKCFGREIFHGVFDRSNWASHVIAADYSPGKILFHEGMGAGLIIFVIPGFLFFIFKALRAKVSIEKAALFLMPVFLYLIWRYAIPLANLRYLYPALAIGYISPFYFLSQRRPYLVIARVLVILCSLAACFEISTRLELIASLILLVFLFFSLRGIYSLLLKLKPPHWLMIFLAAAAGLYMLNNDYNKNEFNRYSKMVKYSGFWPDAAKAWEWLDKNTDGDNIAYVGRPVPFPLYGSNFKNNVFYVSVNDTEPAMIHYFPNSHYQWGKDFMELHKNLEAEGNYRGNADYGVWLKNLKGRNTGYLFIYSLHQAKEIAFPVEDGWAKDNPDKFIRVFSNLTIHIYKLRL